jgi:predicted DCC family thiol-disulfide oxidoreductase YuxK
MTDAVAKIVKQMRGNPQYVRFNDLCRVCEYYFGELRQKSSSHRIYRTHWQGDPRINIQDDNGKAKAYQVRQVLRAIEKLEAQNGNKNEKED